jgi:hypothetical protein
MQYRTIHYLMDTPDDLTALLNKRAENGWRLHTLCPRPSEFPAHRWLLLVFEREDV